MQQETIEYQHNDLLLEAYIAYDSNKQGPLPTVLIAHDWTGRNDFACQKAEKLAELGYIGFALDMYGKGIQGKDNDEKTKLIEPLLADRQLLQDRMQAALNTAKQLQIVDESKIAAMGFCFGGLCALDLARSGADIKGAISFHGLFNAPENISNKTISAKILALHGYDDPMVPPELVQQFADEMTQAKADWQIHMYGNTQHAFTNPVANDSNLGTIYDKTADQRSWLSMKAFLEEIL